MASPITHAAVALALGAAWHVRGPDWKFLAWGVLCAEIPDADVAGFWLGVPYSHVWGHRGLTHSLLFALVWACVPAYATRPAHRTGRLSIGAWLYFFLATASHSILDAATDAGLGVAFLAPFDNTRYFFHFRPVAAAPLSWQAFFSPIGLRVILSELVWIWLPCAVFMAGAVVLRRKSGQSG